MRWLVVLAVAVSAPAYAETARSPYRMSWGFPGNEMSTIDVDRGDLSASRFESDYDLVRYLATQAKLPRKAPPKRPGEASIPDRELKIEQLAPGGAVRSTVLYSQSLAAWRKQIGERMVERLEDEFDAHLRMIFPRRVPAQEMSPRSPPDMSAP